MKNTSSHRDLCSLAVRWLKRPHNAGGPGCAVALSECKTGYSGETPDAIGFRFGGTSNTDLDGSVVVEVKTSRADFLADAKKPHRRQGGCGNWRYYLAPAGIIQLPDLPEKWGLLEVNPRGHIQHVAGPLFDIKHLRIGNGQPQFRAAFVDWKQPADPIREMFLLTHALQAVGDAEKLKNMLKEASNARFRLAAEVAELREQVRELRAGARVRRRERLQADAAMAPHQETW